MLLLLTFLLQTLPGWAARAPIEGTPVGHAVSSLKVVGISEETIRVLEESFEPEMRDKIVGLSVLGFLGKADYEGHYSKTALKKCRAFLKKYAKVLKQTEAWYGVSKESVTALLWVETKFGTDMGKFSVANVFFSLLQGPHPDVMRQTLQQLAARAPEEYEKYKQSAIDRSYAKANWALREISSLDEMRKTRGTDIRRLKGSYAGAFGIPQFIPSSYLQWARPVIDKINPNLYEMRDAIQSVGFYLKANGWLDADLQTKKAALYHYNRADGYVNVILKIAAELKAEPTSQVRLEELRSGDLLLQPLDCEVCKLIEKEERTAFSHVGIVVIKDGKPSVLEAYDKVEEVTLEHFLKRTKPNAAIVVLRAEKRLRCGSEKICARRILERFYKNYDGGSYDKDYLWTNKDQNGKESQYCAELVAKLMNPFYKTALQPKPMHFSSDREAWTKNMGKTPPIQQVGLSPGDIERARGFERLGELRD